MLNFVFSSLEHYFSNKMPYYAVAKGRKLGIYTTWDECSSQVNKYSGSIYKKFATESEAQNFIKERSSLNTRLNYIKTETPQCTKKREAAVTKTNIPLTLSSSKRTLRAEFPKNDEINYEFPIYSSKRRVFSNSESNLFTKKNNIGKVDFIMDEDGYVNVFTDGACSSNGHKKARAGIGVWFQDHHPLNISLPVEGRPTNNMAEIQAVTIAARQAKKAGIKKLKINTDSKFIISCITDWMPKWKRTGWMTIENKPVINKTELLEMEKELESLIVTWNHVNGHVGIYGNEMADKLAKEGCSRYKDQDG